MNQKIFLYYILNQNVLALKTNTIFSKNNIAFQKIDINIFSV